MLSLTDAARRRAMRTPFAGVALGTAAFPSSLFLLGLGWSLCFVAGSALLSRGQSYAALAKLQGTTDAVVWMSAALSSLGSGILLASAGYIGLCIVAAAIVTVPLTIIASRRRAIAAVIA